MQSIFQRRVLDISVSELAIAEQGVCNFCKDFDKQISDYVLLEEKVNKIFLTYQVLLSINVAQKS